jgi:3-dehydroquinate synthase
MQTIDQHFQIDYSYSIFFTQHLFSTQNQALSTFLKSFSETGFQRKAFFVIDEGLMLPYPTLTDDIRAYFSTNVPSVQLVNNLLIVPGGEEAKNDPVLFDNIVQAIDDQGIDRHSLVIAVGGGAVLDLVGYAAAVSHRGIRHIRIPTTVLSQNDSGVGVKNGINYQGKKNFLGTFAPPIAVFNDSEFLKTLDDRDWRGGISEAIKVSLIKDRSFFEWIEENAKALARREMAPMEQLVYRCAEMHTEHIRSGDPFEFGSSRPLDFGHWAAHKLEYLTNFEIRHGEAVAIGIALDSVYSYKKGQLTETELDRIIHVFQEMGFELYHPKLAENDKINLRNGLQEFREHLGGRLTIMLLEAIGRGVEVHEMDDTLIAESVDYLESHCSNQALA